MTQLLRFISAELDIPPDRPSNCHHLKLPQRDKHFSNIERLVNDLLVIKGVLRQTHPDCCCIRLQICRLPQVGVEVLIPVLQSRTVSSFKKPTFRLHSSGIRFGLALVRRRSSPPFGNVEIGRYYHDIYATFTQTPILIPLILRLPACRSP